MPWIVRRAVPFWIVSFHSSLGIHIAAVHAEDACIGEIDETSHRRTDYYGATLRR